MTAFISSLMAFCIGWAVGGLTRAESRRDYDRGFNDGFHYHSKLSQRRIILDNLRESKLQGLEEGEEKCQECHFIHG